MRESAVPPVDRRERLFCVHELVLGGRIAFCHLTRQAVPASRNAGAVCPRDVAGPVAVILWSIGTFLMVRLVVSQSGGLRAGLTNRSSQPPTGEKIDE